MVVQDTANILVRVRFPFHPTNVYKIQLYLNLRVYNNFFLKKGALTFKPYAFYGRAWERKKKVFFDVLSQDGFKQFDITFILKKGILLIESNVGYTIDNWLVNETRVVYTGFFTRRLYRPLLFIINKRLQIREPFFISYKESFSYLCGIFRINVIKNCLGILKRMPKFATVLTDNMGFEEVITVSNFIGKDIKHYVNAQSDFIADIFYKIPEEFKNIKVVLVIGVNLRLKDPKLFLELRLLQRKGQIQILNLCSTNPLGITIGSTKDDFLKFLVGKHSFYFNLGRLRAANIVNIPLFIEKNSFFDLYLKSVVKTLGFFEKVRFVFGIVFNIFYVKDKFIVPFFGVRGLYYNFSSLSADNKRSKVLLLNNFIFNSNNSAAIACSISSFFNNKINLFFLHLNKDFSTFMQNRTIFFETHLPQKISNIKHNFTFLIFPSISLVEQVQASFMEKDIRFFVPLVKKVDKLMSFSYIFSLFQSFIKKMVYGTIESSLFLFTLLRLRVNFKINSNYRAVRRNDSLLQQKMLFNLIFIDSSSIFSSVYSFPLFFKNNNLLLTFSSKYKNTFYLCFKKYYSNTFFLLKKFIYEINFDFYKDFDFFFNIDLNFFLRKLYVKHSDSYSFLTMSPFLRFLKLLFYVNLTTYQTNFLYKKKKTLLFFFYNYLEVLNGFVFSNSYFVNFYFFFSSFYYLFSKFKNIKMITKFNKEDNNYFYLFKFFKSYINNNNVDHSYYYNSSSIYVLTLGVEYQQEIKRLRNLYASK